VPSHPIGNTVVWAVGDGADGGSEAEQVTRLLADRRLDRLLYLGDVYQSGTALDFASNYDPDWGQFAPLTAPVAGNHEWSNALDGYFPYWEQIHGAPVPAYYSFRLSGWQLFALNSQAPHGAASPQGRWLGRTLERTSRFGNCRIAFWHRPRWSAGRYADADDMAPIWQLLSGRARVALAGHDHNMQRLQPIDGISQFVSGAGGHGLYSVDATDPRLTFGDDSHHGALRLRLEPEHLGWRFVSTAGEVLAHGGLGCKRA
jgi:calcineurin-like phosphoesterase family protein